MQCLGVIEGTRSDRPGMSNHLGPDETHHDDGEDDYKDIDVRHGFFVVSDGVLSGWRAVTLQNSRQCRLLSADPNPSELRGYSFHASSSVAFSHPASVPHKGC